MKRLALFSVLVLIAFGASCRGPSFDPPWRINSLRVLAAAPAPVYARPGEEVTVSLSWVDGTVPPRDVQLTWLGGCFDPEDGVVAGCFDQIAARFETGDLSALSQVSLPAELSGVPDSVQYTLAVPEDVLDDAGVAEGTGVPYARGFVFFALCAGTVALVPPSGEESFPLGCFDESGVPIGAEGFVPGYTELFVFGDGRRNSPPLIEGLSLDGIELPTTPGDARMPVCPPVVDEGCYGSDEICVGRELRVHISDVAELDVEAAPVDGIPVREVVYLRIYVDRGELERSQLLVSDGLSGFQGEPHILWTPPREPGLVRFWVVVLDNRGATSVLRRQIVLE